MKNGKRYKWEVLGLLWFAFLLNQADRQAFNVVLPLIRDDLHLTDAGAGVIATIFNLVYAILVPLAGYIGDVFSRKWLVVISILFFSVATMFTGMSNTVIMLIIMRSLATGGGEAMYGPPNYALLASYHKETRAFAMSIHQTSYYIGIIISGYVAGYIGQTWGWRSAFYAFGAIGIIYGALHIVFAIYFGIPGKIYGDGLMTGIILIGLPLAFLLYNMFTSFHDFFNFSGNTIALIWFIFAIIGLTIIITRLRSFKNQSV